MKTHKLFKVQFRIFVLLSLLYLGGCASLSKGQIKAVESFTASCDSFSKHPALLFDDIAHIRAERSFWYSASLSTPELRVDELNSMYAAYVKDNSLAKKVDASVEILLTYKRALKILAGNARWEDAGREFRSLGRTLDSLVLKFNQLQLTDALPLGVGKSAGRVAGYMVEINKRHSQARAVRAFVIQADTIVGIVAGVLCDLLTSPSVNLLIENEIRGVEQNYISYLKASAINHSFTFKPILSDTLKSNSSDAFKPNSSDVFKLKISLIGDPFQSDKRYFELKGRAESLTKRKASTITALRHLARAHKKLSSELQKGKQVADFWAELLKFNNEIDALRRNLKAIKI